PAPVGAAPAAAPVSSPTAAYMLSDRVLKGGGPKFGLPLARAMLFPRGLAGWLDLSVGVSAGKDSRFENVALNGQLELAPGLRAPLGAGLPHDPQPALHARGWRPRRPGPAPGRLLRSLPADVRRRVQHGGPLRRAQLPGGIQRRPEPAMGGRRREYLPGQGLG